MNGAQGKLSSTWKLRNHLLLACQDIRSQFASNHGNFFRRQYGRDRWFGERDFSSCCHATSRTYDYQDMLINRPKKSSLVYLLRKRLGNFFVRYGQTFDELVKVSKQAVMPEQENVQSALEKDAHLKIQSFSQELRTPGARGNHHTRRNNDIFPRAAETFENSRWTRVDTLHFTAVQNFSTHALNFFLKIDGFFHCEIPR